MNRTKKLSEILRRRSNFVLKSWCSIKQKKGRHLESVSYFSIFVPKSKCSLKKKRSSPKFGNYFLQLTIVAALKFLILPKFFISLPKKFWFCPNIFLSLTEKFEFSTNFGNLGAQLPPCPPPGTAIVLFY